MPRRSTAAVLEAEEAVEGESRELMVRPDTGMDATGTLAIAGLSDEEFEHRLEALRKGADRIAKIQRALMEKDVDYGVIPGTKKPTLLKPGAEKLCLAYSLAGDFEPRRTIGDGITTPHLSYLTRCALHRGSIEGPIVAVGYGAANSWETRYRYRNGERTCPSCSKVGTVIKGKAEYGGGWLCFAKKGGCGSKWPDGTQEIEGQVVGQVDNPDPFDLDVTLAKMAEKRAHVDATLRATGASSLFTQDMEDQPADAPPLDDAPPPQSQGETEELVGVEAREGTVKVGGAAGYKLEVRQTPDGSMAFGFTLETAKGNIPQVLIEGDLAAAILVAEGNEPERLKGHWCRVKGKVYSVRQAGRAGYFRMRVQEFETRDYKLPADIAGPVPPDAADTPSAAATAAPSPPASEDEAELDLALELVP